MSEYVNFFLNKILFFSHHTNTNCKAGIFMERFNYNSDNNSDNLGFSINYNIERIKDIAGGTSDLLFNDFEICGIKANLLCCEGMYSSNTISDLVLSPLMNINLPKDTSAEKIREHITKNILLSTDRNKTNSFEKLFRFINSGFAAILIDGLDEACVFGIQGYAVKSISSPSGENNILGSQEGFCEVIRTNMSLVRRRMKSPLLRLHLFTKGKISQTDLCLCYLSDRVPKELIKSVYESIEKADLETILSNGYIQPFIENRNGNMFDTVSTTERPDVFCAKLLEGRIGLLIDGTPFAFVIPKLFCESFQTIDDYNFRPSYTTLIRFIKYSAFWLSLLLPAVYIAVVLFSPGLLNSKLLLILAESEKNAPFPLSVETIGIFLLYEIIREAGLRLPKSVGGSVSIIAGLIVGDAAVSSGLISTPLLTISAIAILSGLVVPDLSCSLTVLRFLLIIAAALTGLFGVGIVLSAILFNLCGSENFGFPATAPLTPFYKKSMRDFITRVNFRKMQNGGFTIEEYKE